MADEDPHSMDHPASRKPAQGSRRATSQTRKCRRKTLASLAKRPP
jgi:hypothetical protein